MGENDINAQALGDHVAKYMAPLLTPVILHAIDQCVSPAAVMRPHSRTERDITYQVGVQDIAAAPNLLPLFDGVNLSRNHLAWLILDDRDHVQCYGVIDLSYNAEVN